MAGGRRSRAAPAVSSFGFGGTNAHVILEAAPALPVADESPRTGRQLLTLSAAARGALRRWPSGMRSIWPQPGAPAWAAVCATSHQGRSHFAERLARRWRPTRASAAERLHDLAGERCTRAGVAQRRARARPRRQWRSCFRGRGWGWPGWARRCMPSAPVFRAALDHCAALLAPDWELT